MKKLLKLLGILLVAGLMFAGCSKGDNKYDFDDPEDLVKSVDATIDADSIEVSDGDWILTVIAESDNSSLMGMVASVNSSYRAYVTITGDKLTYNELLTTETITITIPEGTPDSAVDEYIKEANANDDGYTTKRKGDKIVRTKQASTKDKDEIAKIIDDSEAFFPESVNDLKNIKYMQDGAIKTNSDKSEYLVTGKMYGMNVTAALIKD